MEDIIVLLSSESDSSNSNSPPRKNPYVCTGNDDLRLGLEEEDECDRLGLLGLPLNNSSNKRRKFLLDEWSPHKYDQNSEDRARPSSSTSDCIRVVHDISCSESSFEDLGGLSPQLNSDEDGIKPNPGRVLHDLSDEDDTSVGGDIKMSPEKDVTVQFWSDSRPRPTTRPSPNVEDLFVIRPTRPSPSSELNSDEDRGSPSSVSQNHSDEDEVIKISHEEDTTLQYDAWIDLSPAKSMERTSHHTSTESGLDLCDNEVDLPQDQIENNRLHARLSSLFCNAGSTNSTHIIVKPLGSTDLVQESKKTKSSSTVTIKKVSVEEKQLAAKLRKEAREAERAKKLAEKAELKAAKLALSKARQLLKPEESIKYLSVVLDNNIFELDLGGNLYNQLESIGVTYSVESQLIPLSVNWVRKNPNICSGTSIQHEQHSLLLLPCDQLAKLIKNHELCSYVKSVQAIAPNNSFTLILFAVENIFKKRKKNVEEYKLSREELTEALVEVQLFTNTCHRFVENCLDLATTISQFSKAVAEIPYKLEKQKKEQEKLEWFGESDSRDCVRVDKNGNGLMRLWRQQLCEFNLAGLQIAEAITAIYPSPQSLFQAYDCCSSQSEREKMLQDIQIRRGVGALSSARRIGPELSKKLHTFFTTLDGDVELSNE